MRLVRHLFARSARHLFPEDSLQRIADAISAGELRHRGEIMFAVESELPVGMVLRGIQARQRAEATFARLRTWDTEANNGVLIYLLLAEHRIEIVADRGLNQRVSPSQWQEVMGRMRASFRQGQFEAGLNDAIDAVDALLVRHFQLAPGQANPNELSDRPHLRG